MFPHANFNVGDRNSHGNHEENDEFIPSVLPIHSYPPAPSNHPANNQVNVFVPHPVRVPTPAPADAIQYGRIPMQSLPPAYGSPPIMNPMMHPLQRALQHPINSFAQASPINLANDGGMMTSLAVMTNGQHQIYPHYQMQALQQEQVQLQNNEEPQTNRQPQVTRQLHVLGNPLLNTRKHIVTSQQLTGDPHQANYQPQSNPQSTNQSQINNGQGLNANANLVQEEQGPVTRPTRRVTRSSSEKALHGPRTAATVGPPTLQNARARARRGNARKTPVRSVTKKGRKKTVKQTESQGPGTLRHRSEEDPGVQSSQAIAGESSNTAKASPAKVQIGSEKLSTCPSPKQQTEAGYVANGRNVSPGNIDQVGDPQALLPTGSNVGLPYQASQRISNETQPNHFPTSLMMNGMPSSFAPAYLPRAPVQALNHQVMQQSSNETQITSFPANVMGNNLPSNFAFGYLPQGPGQPMHHRVPQQSMPGTQTRSYATNVAGYCATPNFATGYLPQGPSQFMDPRVPHQHNIRAQNGPFHNFVMGNVVPTKCESSILPQVQTQAMGQTNAAVVGATPDPYSLGHTFENGQGSRLLPPFEPLVFGSQEKVNILLNGNVEIEKEIFVPETQLRRAAAASGLNLTKDQLESMTKDDALQLLIGDSQRRLMQVNGLQVRQTDQQGLGGIPMHPDPSIPFSFPRAPQESPETTPLDNANGQHHVISHNIGNHAQSLPKSLSIVPIYDIGCQNTGTPSNEYYPVLSVPKKPNEMRQLISTNIRDSGIAPSASRIPAISERTESQSAPASSTTANESMVLRRYPPVTRSLGQTPELKARLRKFQADYGKHHIELQEDLSKLSEIPNMDNGKRQFIQCSIALIEMEADHPRGASIEVIDRVDTFLSDFLRKKLRLQMKLVAEDLELQNNETGQNEKPDRGKQRQVCQSIKEAKIPINSDKYSRETQTPRAKKTGPNKGQSQKCDKTSEKRNDSDQRRNCPVSSNSHQPPVGIVTRARKRKIIVNQTAKPKRPGRKSRNRHTDT